MRDYKKLFVKINMNYSDNITLIIYRKDKYGPKLIFFLSSIMRSKYAFQMYIMFLYEK